MNSLKNILTATAFFILVYLNAADAYLKVGDVYSLAKPNVPAGVTVSVIDPKGVKETDSYTFKSTKAQEATVGYSYCNQEGEQTTVRVSVAWVELKELHVANATQENVTGEKNWAAVKEAGKFVTVTAVLNPAVPANQAKNLITWSGGEEIKDNPLARKVPKDSAAKTTVKVTCGTKSKEVDIWIIWAEVKIQVSGNKPFGAAALQFTINNPVCGTTTNINKSMGYGNMCGEITLLPAGIGKIVNSGWDIKRNRISRDYCDGVKSSVYWELDWTNDDNSNTDEILTPVNDKIYVIDTPNIFAFEGAEISAETNNNFQEWVKWNGEDCSDKENWYYKGKWLAGPPNAITNHDIGVGHMLLPVYNDNN